MSFTRHSKFFDVKVEVVCCINAKNSLSNGGYIQQSKITKELTLTTFSHQRTVIPLRFADISNIVPSSNYPLYGNHGISRDKESDSVHVYCQI